MSFRVTIQPSGHSFELDSEETVLDAALRHGFAFPYGCRNGACGSCMGKVIAGRIEYPGERPPVLTDNDEQIGQAVFCQARARSDLEIEVREIGSARQIVAKRLPARVESVEQLSHDVVRLRLRLPAAERMQFLAGQYIDVLLSDGRRRSFSLANAPHLDDTLELHIRHVPGGSFTDFVFAGLKEKSLLRIEGPLGAFCLQEQSERPILMVAGGTGIAPIKGMIEHIRGIGMDRPLHIFWGVRSARDLYLQDTIEEWLRAEPEWRYTPVLSDPQPEDEWQGASGFVHEEVLRQYPDPGAYDVYMSGPPIMVKSCRASLAAAGLDPDHMYSDPFDFAEDTQRKIREAGGDPDALA